MNEELPDVSEQEKEVEKLLKTYKDAAIYPPEVLEQLEQLKGGIAKGHNYVFIGKVGQFCPMQPGYNGGLLLREVVDKKTGVKSYAAATGAKGYRWLESEMVQKLEKEDGIDRGYYNALVDTAVNDISQYGDFEWFVSNDPYVKTEGDTPPWDAAGQPWEDSSSPFDVR